MEVHGNWTINCLKHTYNYTCETNVSNVPISFHYNIANLEAIIMHLQ